MYARHFEIQLAYSSAGLEVLTPAAWYIDFNVERVIREELFADSDFCKYRTKGRDEEGGYYNSE